MRIIFVRHGDPDYEHDTLTEKGHREARFWESWRRNCIWETVICRLWEGRSILLSTA